MSDDGTNLRSNGSDGGAASAPGPDACVLDGLLGEEARIAALARAHEFPGFFPVVVIARQDAAFEAVLEATVTEMQGDAPYRVRRRPSRHGRYMSYRLELHVGDAGAAMACRTRLATLPGVVMLL